MVSSWHRSGSRVLGITGNRNTQYKYPNPNEVLKVIVPAIENGQTFRDALQSKFSISFNNTFSQTLSKHPAVIEAMKKRAVKLKLAGSIYYKAAMEDKKRGIA